jgi:hypothetical protein
VPITCIATVATTRNRIRLNGHSYSAYSTPTIYPMKRDREPSVRKLFHIHSSHHPHSTLYRGVPQRRGTK